MGSVHFTDDQSVERAFGALTTWEFGGWFRVNSYAVAFTQVFGSHDSGAGEHAVGCDTEEVGSDTLDVYIFNGAVDALSVATGGDTDWIWICVQKANGSNNYVVKYRREGEGSITTASGSPLTLAETLELTTIFFGDDAGADADTDECGVFIRTGNASDGDLFTLSNSLTPTGASGFDTWLRMSTGATAGTNTGTAGNFTINGSPTDEGDEPSLTGPGSPSTLTPTDGAVCASLSGAFTLAGFAENVKAGTGNITVKNLTDASTIETIDITDTGQVTFSSTTGFTFTTTSALPANKLIAIQIASGAVLSEVDDEAWSGFTTDTAWNFDTYDVNLVAAGTFAATAAAATTVSVPYPTTGGAIVAGDKLVTIIGQRPGSANSGTCTTPGSWDRGVERTGATDGDTGGYTTTIGADTGNMNAYSFSITASGGESGNLSVTVDGGTNSVCWGQMLQYRKRADLSWSAVGGTSGKRTQNTTPAAGSVSEVMAADPGVIAADQVLISMVIPTDVNGGTTWSSQGVSQTGVTFSAITESAEPFSSNGNDIGGFTATGRADAGTSSVAPTVTATKGGTTTNTRGPILFIRLRAASSAPPGEGQSGGGIPARARMALLGVG